MLSVFDGLRGVTMLSVFIKLLIALLCGGAIGLERSYKRRPAGFRTHILVCVAASVTMLTSEYLYIVMNYYTDMARLGAQVIAGMGFIGAGTIIVTRRSRVKGLTTAAGLWGAAIVGLAIGAGFIEGGILATVLIIVAEVLFSGVEDWMMHSAPEINLYVEYTDKDCLEEMLRLIRDKNIAILNLQITRSFGNEKHNACAIFSLRLNRRHHAEEVIADLSAIKNVNMVYEL